jgi:ribosomal protein S18 acetylase RimI-like enzyme
VGTIEQVDEVSEEVVEAFGRLVPQLSRSATPPSADELGVIASSPDTTLLVARGGRGGAIIGSLTLVCVRIPTGIRAWIEDVVVDESVRGLGIGEALTREAIGLAQGTGARSVDLTSHPAREPANRLYRRLGFEQRETNVYRYPL